MASQPSPKVDDVLAEVESISESLGTLVARLQTEEPTEIEVWLLYERCEKAVAKLRYRLATERPGFFTELPKSKRPSDFLSGALDDLGVASMRIREGKLLDGLESFRSARTRLRAFLAELGRVRARQKRKASLSRRSSSPSS
jgi:hypothetical protein